jgi:hypothetical protein
MPWSDRQLVQKNKIIFVDTATLSESFVKDFSSPFHLLKLVQFEHWL